MGNNEIEDGTLQTPTGLLELQAVKAFMKSFAGPWAIAEIASYENHHPRRRLPSAKARITVSLSNRQDFRLGKKTIIGVPVNANEYHPLLGCRVARRERGHGYAPAEWRGEAVDP